MRFASTQENETLEALVARVYDLGKEPPATLARTVRRELIDANPYLKTIDRVPTGTLVAVPEIEGAAFGEHAREPDPVALSVAGGQFPGALALMRGVIADALGAEATDARDATAFLRSAEVRARARGDEQLKAELPGMIEAAAARADDAGQLEAYSTGAFAQAETDLADLMQAFG